MSTKVQNLVWQSDVGPANKRLLLLALADNANDRGFCKPGVAYSAGKTQTGRSTVFRLLNALEEEGLLERRERRRKNGSRRSNAYRINLEGLERRRRIVSKDETDELEALFDDDGVDEPDEVSAGGAHSPEPGPCEAGLDESAGQPHSPGAGPSGRIVPERDGGGPGAGRAEGPGAGPLEPSVGPSREGGAPAGRGASGSPAPRPGNGPPPRSLPVMFVLEDRDTWLCRTHAARPPAPGEYRPPCGPCGGVRRYAEAQLAAAESARAAAERAAAEVAAACRRRDWCDAHGHVLERPGVPLHPLTRCDHVRPPELVVAEVRAADEPPPIASAPDPVADGEPRRTYMRKSQLDGVSHSHSATR